MSWVTNKPSITTVLTTASYREIPSVFDIEEAPESYNHKCYILRPVGLADLEVQTAVSQIQSDVIQLDIVYKHNTISDYETNFELFRTILTAIKNLSLFAGFYDDGEFTRFENNSRKAKASIRFIYGHQGC